MQGSNPVTEDWWRNVDSTLGAASQPSNAERGTTENDPWQDGTDPWTNFTPGNAPPPQTTTRPTIPGFGLREPAKGAGKGSESFAGSVSHAGPDPYNERFSTRKAVHDIPPTWDGRDPQTQLEPPNF